MQKRGQVAIFLLVGILLLALSAAIFYIVKTRVSEPLGSEGETTLSGLRFESKINAFVESCLHEIAVPGIYLMGIQGGLLYPEDPQTILLTENALLNYGYLNGVSYFSIEKMEADLSAYVHDHINTCLNDFAEFEKEGITFAKRKDQDVSSTIKDDEILIRLSYSGEFMKGDDTTRIDTYSVKIPLRLGAALKSANTLIQKQQKNPSSLSLFTIPDYFISYHPFDENTIIYSLADEKAALNNAPLTFMFAVRNENTNRPPVLDFIPDFTLRKGNPLAYEVTASDDDDDLLIFTADNTHVRVNEGNIFTFVSEESGIFPVTITVADSHGEKDEQNFKIVVKE